MDGSLHFHTINQIVIHNALRHYTYFFSSFLNCIEMRKNQDRKCIAVHVGEFRVGVNIASEPSS
jgi:hypothetical protein